jgi:hypothetical protein
MFPFVLDYFAWHSRERNKLNATNWQDSRYLILSCKKDERCGGLSDRLKPLPLLILTANRTNRLFMIRWEKPAKLEAFLVPNKWNWSVPDYMLEPMDSKQLNLRNHGLTNQRGYKKLRILREGNSSVDMTVVSVILQDSAGGEKEYQELTAEANNVSENENVDTYKSIYHDLFQCLFTPSPPIQILIDEQMASARLTPGEYAVAHYRAFYKSDDVSEAKLKKDGINAVNCASNLRPGGPVYFASDSKYAVEAALKYGKETNRTIVSYDGPDPLHIELQWKNHSVSEFYSVFVDLYLMGKGRCIASGKGGFGSYALLMSYNSTCKWYKLGG